MSFSGRIVAGARELSLGGPLGSLLGRAARCLPQSLVQRLHGSRSPDPRRSIAFTIAVIALGAKMAKADGTVSRDEVAAFREVFQVPPQEETHLRRVFDLARRSTAGSSIASSIASVSKLATRRRRETPRAMRMPISRRRRMQRASIRFVALEQAINSTSNETAPSREAIFTSGENVLARAGRTD